MIVWWEVAVGLAQIGAAAAATTAVIAGVVTWMNRRYR